MAEEQTNVKGSIAGQTFEIATGNILPILLLLGGLVGGYLIWVQTDKRFDLMQQHHIRIMETLLKAQQETTAQTEQIRHLLLIHDYNNGREPHEKLPLEFDPSKLPAKPPAP
jgi:hypothetical protein